MRCFLHLFLVVLTTAVATQVGEAAFVTATTVRNFSAGSFTHAAVDSVTGKVYERTGTGLEYNSQNSFRVYDSVAAFETGSVYSSLTLNTNGPAGTYFAAADDKLFGRRGSGTATRRWNATTGAWDVDGLNYANMGGTNGAHTFEFGAFSAASLLQDNTGLYVFGKNTSGNLWQMVRIDSNLNVLESKTFLQTQADNYGYSALINGTLFLGDSFDSAKISTAFNFATGTVSNVDFTLSGLGSNPYLHSTFYDADTDSLYLANRGNSRYFKVSNASDQFGVPVTSPVPEPASMAFWALGAFAAIAYRRK